MSLVVARLIKIIRDPDNWILILIFLSPAFFLVIKGWTNSILFLIFFICSWRIIKEPRAFLMQRGGQFWLIVVCLLSPFLAEFMAQLGRGALVGSSLDGPSRAILASGVFIYLSKKNIPNLIPVLGLGSALGVLSVFLYLIFLPEHYWGHRAATHFVDPITLPCFTFALLGLFLFGNYPKMAMTTVVGFKLLAIFLATYVALESLSRSAWVAGAALVAVYFWYSLRGSILKQVIGFSILAMSVVCVFYYSDIYRSRLHEAYVGLTLFLESGGGQSNSVGQRMILMLIDVELIRNNPFFGISDGVIPAFEDLKPIIPSLSKEIYDIKVLAGSHSEFFAQLVRKGLFLGSFAIWGLFGYPVYLIICEYFRETSLSGELEKLLGLVTPLIFSGMTIQIFNLKMTTSFYMLFLAVLLGFFHQKRSLLQPQ